MMISAVAAILHFNYSPLFLYKKDGYKLGIDVPIGLGRADQTSQPEDTKPPNFSPSPSSNSENNSIDVITTAFKFSDDQISKTEESKRNFEQTTAAHIASGKFIASMPTEFDATRSKKSFPNIF